MGDQTSPILFELSKHYYMKEIHFYTNLTNEDQTSEWDLDTMCVDYCTSNEAIENPDERIVKTTQLCLLRNAWDYISRGDRVFIHNGNEVFEVLEGKYENTDKEIRRGMDMSRLLLGGTFGELC